MVETLIGNLFSLDSLWLHSLSVLFAHVISDSLWGRFHSAVIAGHAVT